MWSGSEQVLDTFVVLAAIEPPVSAKHSGTMVFCDKASVDV